MFFAAATFAAEAPIPATIEFNRDVRPILANTCFLCHGPDKTSRKAQMRLDIRDEAMKRTRSGAIPIVPGKTEQSEFIRRVFATADDDDLMPPAKAHKPLTARQKEVLRRWIAQGAIYQQHWSYEKAARPPVPAGQNAIDFLVQKRLIEIGLEKSPPADRRILIRRLYFDLIGLPPNPAEVEAFIKDNSLGAYEKVVDRLLQNPHYGERMAIGWLDVVRFADTIGYHSDNPRNVWPWRDWVIQSFNDNKHFDRFTLEQIAGDLLPDSSQETRVGSAFNRLLLSTEEGGAQPKDYQSRMLTDRVRAIGAAWLGQTTGCAQCHDHKFDPFSQRDFYSLGAFFADLQEPIVGKREEGMLVASPQQAARLAELDAQLAELKGKLPTILPQLQAERKKWEADVVSGNVTLAELQADSIASAAEKKTARNVVNLLKRKTRKLKPAEKEIIDAYFRTKVTKSTADSEAFAKIERDRKALYDSIPKCIVSISMPNHRTVRILPRGNWMDESGEIVKPALPHFLPQPKIEGREPTRLDLAQWLISRDNPLTARVFVNRLWKQFLGVGLSKNLDDLGTQGEWPANPELLDYLACEFVDSGWDIKHLVRAIVTSETYRQTSIATPAQLARDPYNRENARQGRFRLDAELVRDNALAISGLLVPRIGGPSVKPYQPDGYWENLNFPPRTYVSDKGENQYRRGLYIWWQRSFLHPSLLAFDAPSREECTAERSRSNIPQQALALLNDPTYVEASRALAARILMECHGSVDQRIAWAWQQALQRDPAPDEIRIARALLEQNLAIYRNDSPTADALLQAGMSPIPPGLEHGELAAWTHVARVLLNLHETITRE